MNKTEVMMEFEELLDRIINENTEEEADPIFCEMLERLRDLVE